MVKLYCASRAAQRLAADFLHNYIFLAVGRVGSSTDLIVQHIEYVAPGDKRQVLLDLINTVEVRSLPPPPLCCPAVACFALACTSIGLQKRSAFYPAVLPCCVTLPLHAWAPARRMNSMPACLLLGASRSNCCLGGSSELCNGGSGHALVKC
jgi:hypothetical protein